MLRTDPAPGAGRERGRGLGGMAAVAALAPRGSALAAAMELTFAWSGEVPHAPAGREGHGRAAAFGWAGRAEAQRTLSEIEAG